jgi:hypothetical protein
MNKMESESKNEQELRLHNEEWSEDRYFSVHMLQMLVQQRLALRRSPGTSQPDLKALEGRSDERLAYPRHPASVCFPAQYSQLL